MTSTGTETITRAEAAYAHLASFQRGDAVDVAGPRFYLPGTVTTPMREGTGGIETAHLSVSGGTGFEVAGSFEVVTVAALLSGHRTITSLAAAKAGNVRYFDEAGYTAQNS